MENLVLFDWLSVTLPLEGEWPSEGDCNDGSVFINLLGLQNIDFEVCDGVRGFRSRLWFDGINIHLPSEKQPYCWLEMSGSGCRAFETYGSGDWNHVLRVVVEYCNVTRIDIAFDDHSGILDMAAIVNDTYFKPSFVSKSHYHEVQLSYDDRTNERGTSIYHGKESSNTLIRIYDKAAQLGYESENHWIRIEIQLRRENAVGFIQAYLQSNCLGDTFAGVLVDNLRYCERSDSDSNKWRWPLTGYWSELVSDATRIRLLTTPGVEYNLSNLESYVFGQAGNSIRCFIDCFGEDAFIKRLREDAPVTIPSKYKELVRKYKNNIS